MDQQRQWEAYFQVLTRWGTPEDLERVLRWCSPDELREILKTIGPPEEAEKLIRAVKERAEDWSWSKTARVKFSAAAKLIVLVGAVVVILRPFLQRIAAWWTE